MPVFWDSYIGGTQSLGIVGEQTVLALDQLGLEVIVRPWNLSPALRRLSFDSEREATDAGYKWGDEALNLLLPRTRELVCKGMGGVAVSRERTGISITWGSVEDLERTYWRHVRSCCGYFYCNDTWMSRRQVNICNRMDCLFVPSQFVKSVALRSGVDVPVYVWPHGVDTNLFHPAPSSGDRDVYTFLFVGVAQFRKGIFELSAAFRRAFDSNQADVQLVISSSDWGYVDGIRRMFPDERIIWLHETLSRDHVADLMRSADCLMLPSRGEAFGLPLLEGMASGLPVVYTRHGGQCDFCDETVGYPIKVKRLEPTFDRTTGRPIDAATAAALGYPEPPQWAIPDIDDMVSIMRHVYENRGEAQSRGRRGRSRAECWKWEDSTSKVYDVLCSL